MLSLPGGPSILSVCIHAGWTMGTVKDVYMWYLYQEISLLDAVWQCCPYCRWKFASSPPPPILFQCMTGGKPTVLSSSLCLTMYHSLCILN